MIYWQEVLPDVLHSVRSLLCTATNCTPHERLFGWARRSTTGNSLPSWLTTPGPVLLKRHVRNSKMDPLVEEVDLIEANPRYAYVSFPDGRHSTVATKHLAPKGERSAPMDFAVGEDNESFPDHTSWPPESQGQFTTRSLADPASLSPEPEGQSTTQPTTSDTSVDSLSTKSSDVEDVTTVDATIHSNERTVLRRSQRERRAVDRLSYNKFFNAS